VSIRLSNTLSGKVEEFAPMAPPEVRMYSCGPTVYDYGHIGNFRTFVAIDILRRFLKQSRYKLHHVMNITDVDDRIIERAAKQGVGVRQYTEKFEKAFLEDMESLHCEHPARGYPKAALFAFCVTLVAYNVLAVLKATLRVVHGTQKVQKEMSLHHLTTEIRETHRGMMIALRPPQWLLFRGMSAKELAAALRELARGVDLAKYKKAPTKPKKPKTARQSGANRPHVSTAKLLAERRKR